MEHFIHNVIILLRIIHEIDTTTVTRTPYRPLFEAPETIVFQERQNKAQLQYSRVAEGKNCEA